MEEGGTGTTASIRRRLEEDPAEDETQVGQSFSNNHRGEEMINMELVREHFERELGKHPGKYSKEVRLGLEKLLDGLEAVPVFLRILSACDETPLDMILYCPACSVIHIDRAEPEKNWLNPPHKSHQCYNCDHIWRPSDRPTYGVHEIKTHGKNDSLPNALPLGGWLKK